MTGGVEFSGMSKNVVVPPAAQAREPVAMPSHSARPGSLKCTCASITPGSTCRPVASISSRASLRRRPAIFPSAMPMAGCGCRAADEQVEVRHVVRLARRMKSRSTASAIAHIRGLHGFGGMMAHPAFAAHEQHRDRADRRDRDGVVARAARQREHPALVRGDGVRAKLRQRAVAGDGFRSPARESTRAARRASGRLPPRCFRSRRTAATRVAHPSDRAHRGSRWRGRG